MSKKTIVGLIFLFVLISVPLTVWALRQQQDTRQRANEENIPSDFRVSCQNDQCATINLTWSKPQRTNYWSFVTLMNKDDPADVQSKWTQSDSIEFSDLTPNSQYNYTVETWYEDFTGCDLSTTSRGDFGDCETDSEKQAAGAYYNLRNTSEKTSGTIAGTEFTANKDSFPSPTTPVSTQPIGNLELKTVESVCTSNNTPAVNIGWEFPNHPALSYYSIQSSPDHSEFDVTEEAQIRDLNQTQTRVPFHSTTPLVYRVVAKKADAGALTVSEWSNTIIAPFICSGAPTRTPSSTPAPTITGSPTNVPTSTPVPPTATGAVSNPTAPVPTVSSVTASCSSLNTPAVDIAWSVPSTTGISHFTIQSSTDGTDAGLIPAPYPADNITGIRQVRVDAQTGTQYWYRVVSRPEPGYQTSVSPWTRVAQAVSSCAVAPTATQVLPTNTPTINNIADINKDGAVNSSDFQIWRCEFLGKGTCQELGTALSSDLNKDGKIDILDFILWKNNAN